MFSVLRNLATAIQLATFANSEGCIRVNPMSSQEVAPLTSTPNKRTPIRLNSDMKYRM